MNILYFLVNLAIAIYSIGYFFWQISDDYASAFFWFRVLMIGIVLINPTFLHFVFILTGAIKKKKIEILCYYLINIVFIFLNLNLQLYDQLEPRFNLGLWPNPTNVFHIYLAFWLWQLIYGFSILLLSLKKTKNIKREQIKYLALASIVGFIGGASNWLIWYKIPIPPYANILISIYVIIIAYAIIKYRFMDIKIALSRAGIFLIVYSIVLGIPFWIGFRTNFGFLSFLLLFIFSTLGPVIFRYLQGKVENILLYREKHYQRFLRESTKNIMRVKDLKILSKLIVSLIKTSVHIDFAALYVFNKEKKHYYLSASEGTLPEVSTVIQNDNPVINLMYTKKEPVSYDLYDNKKFIKSKKSYLFIPSFSENSILCFLILGEKFYKSIYTKQDINTFEIFSNHIALAIENSLFMDENKKIQEREFQAEKLAFIGGMAEGVAHRIKNRLNHFSLAAAGMKIEIENLTKNYPEAIGTKPEIKKAVDSLKDISISLIDNVIRTDHVIQGIINYAHAEETENFFSKIFFDEIIEGAKDLARIKHDIDQFPLNVNIDKSNIIYGIKPQLIECLYNLLDNSYDAIEERIKYTINNNETAQFNPRIEIFLKHYDDFYHIEIADNGIGIKEEDKNKIFAPYFTTKTSYNTKAFSGFGLFVVKRMIEENHRGKLWFESEYMHKTRFYIKLPIHSDTEHK